MFKLKILNIYIFFKKKNLLFLNIYSKKITCFHSGNDYFKCNFVSEKVTNHKPKKGKLHMNE